MQTYTAVYLRATQIEVISSHLDLGEGECVTKAHLDRLRQLYALEKKRLRLVKTCWVGGKRERELSAAFLWELLAAIAEVGTTVKEFDFVALCTQ